MEFPTHLSALTDLAAILDPVRTAVNFLAGPCRLPRRQLDGGSGVVVQELAGQAASPRLPDGKVRRVTEFFRQNRLVGTILLLTAALALPLGLAGCGVVAAPVRVSSAVVKVVPVAGDVVAAPLDVTADVID